MPIRFICAIPKWFREVFSYVLLAEGIIKKSAVIEKIGRHSAICSWDITASLRNAMGGVM